jgi:lactoylglutathione lyase
MIEAIGKVTVYVHSQEKAKTFWTDKMGFTLTSEQPMGPNLTWLEVAPKRDSVTTLVLYPKEAMQKQRPEMVAHPSIMFAASEIDKVWKTLKSKGIEVAEMQSLPYGKMFSFKDNDGNSYLVRD